MLPSKPIQPTAPPYQRRGACSWSSMNCMAQVLGAPVTVTAHMWDRNASSASNPGRSLPSMWSTVCMSREYISIWRRPITRTLPGTQTRDLSLRSTSVHMVSSDSSLAELSSARMFSASSSGSAPRRDRAGDRAGLHPVPGDPHVHLRGGADQALPLAQVEEELVRRRVAVPQQLVERRGRGARRAERLARHHLEQVAAGKPLPGPLHRPRVRSRLRPGRAVIRQNGWRVAACPASRLGLPGQARRAHAVHGELVRVPDRGLPLAVHHVQLVGQVQHQVALAGRAGPGAA